MPDWNAKWASHAPLYGDEPNEGLRMALARSDLSASSALCLADGDGRNGTWLSTRGMRVTAIDFSSEATAQARARDEAYGVMVERIEADLKDWRPEPGRSWTFVVMLYLHCEREIWRGALAAATAALAPGGWVMVEGFGRGQATRPEMGPSTPDQLYDLDALTSALPARATVIEAFEGVARLREGAGHNGEAQIVRLLARAGS